MSRKMSLLMATSLMATNGILCLSQVEQGAINGAVVDSTGASIPNAKVSATNQATGTVASTETTADGYYKLPYLAAGKYTVVVEREGFAVDRVTDGPGLGGQIANINLTLKPGPVPQEATLTATPRL